MRPWNAEWWAEKAGVPLRVFDDQTALKVVDRKVGVVFEGERKLFAQQ